MIITETEVSNLLEKLFDKLFPKDISVTVRGEPTGPVVVIWLHVNGGYAAKIQCLIESDTTILIGDIQHDEEWPKYNKGYGTMMMEKLLEFARENHFSYIHGNLSIVDEDHKDRLHYFYSKFGFTITEYPELQGMYYGKIELYLNQERTE